MGCLQSFFLLPLFIFLGKPLCPSLWRFKTIHNWTPLSRLVSQHFSFLGEVSLTCWCPIVQGFKMVHDSDPSLCLGLCQSLVIFGGETILHLSLKCCYEIIQGFKMVHNWTPSSCVFSLFSVCLSGEAILSLLSAVSNLLGIQNVAHLNSAHSDTAPPPPSLSVKRDANLRVKPTFSCYDVSFVVSPPPQVSPSSSPSLLGADLCRLSPRLH